MRRTTIIFLAVLALASAGAAQAATCTAAEKQAAQAALAAYQKKLPKQRAAYFRKHKRTKLRKAFVKKQQAKLKRLRQAAACEVPHPPDTTAPTLSSAGVNGGQVTLTFDEDLTGSSSPAAFTVTVDGLAWGVEGATGRGEHRESRRGTHTPTNRRPGRLVIRWHALIRPSIDEWQIGRRTAMISEGGIPSVLLERRHGSVRGYLIAAGVGDAEVDAVLRRLRA